MGFCLKARTAWFAAAAGTTTPGTCARRTDTTTRLITATTTWVSGLSCLQLTRHCGFRSADPDKILSCFDGQTAAAAPGLVAELDNFAKAPGARFWLESCLTKSLLPGRASPCQSQHFAYQTKLKLRLWVPDSQEAECLSHFNLPPIRDFSRKSIRIIAPFSQNGMHDSTFISCIMSSTYSQLVSCTLPDTVVIYCKMPNTHPEVISKHNLETSTI